MVKRQSNIEMKKLTKPKRSRGTSSESSTTEWKTSVAHADCFKSMFPWCQNYPGCVPSMISPTIAKWNFKLCSWNVNGLRAWLKAGGLSYLTEESPDVLGIQETKCSIKKVPADAKCSGYEAFWSSADKEGYAGTGLYSKLVPLNMTYGIGDSVHDTEGRVITAEYEKFYYVIACEY
ncbi:AP endonuclease 1 [Paragonimus westermani]|uniref:exodeoxyribonuclease III n=1 Tax=Paragonimus westermani TaxID=34504 RepID=A0A5J4N4C4_9TREM|nr:AP endonuclease 1 [Paragonimus westermani]